MQTDNFQNLIGLITNRDFLIKTEDKELQFEKEYYIYRILPITKRTVGFYWKTPKADEKMLRSFITSFSSKYREPDPRAYDYSARTYGEKYKWENRTLEDRENAYIHHSSNMFSKNELLKQIEDNFSKDGIATGLIKYGFYNTEYGIGIFCFWMTEGVNKAINEMKKHLKELSIPFTNEFSAAKWVYRFKLGLTKETHLTIINKLN